MDVFCFPLHDAVASSDVKSKPVNKTPVPEDVENNNLNITVKKEEESTQENTEAKVGEGVDATMINLQGDNTCSSTSNFEVKAKEVLTAFSRSCGVAGGSSNLFPQPYLNSFQLNSNSKLGSFFDQLSSWTEDNSRDFNLPNFVVAGIASNLKSLGVEEIDGKEYVESWLAQRRQRHWKNSLGRQTLSMLNRDCADSSACIQGFNSLLGSRNYNSEFTSSTSNTEKSETLNVFSPSKPNSSLLRLTGEGNVKLGQFLSKMDEVRCHLNNAACTLLQATVVLTLPYMKLLSGNQLTATSCETFIEEWIQIVGMMALDLKPESGKEVNMMLNREYRSLRSETAKLYKRLGKLYKRIFKLFQRNEKDAKPVLQRLQPKGLPLSKGRRTGNDSDGTAEKAKNAHGNNMANSTAIVEHESQVPGTCETLQFSPVPLCRANLTVTELFRKHIFFTKSKQGFLVCKNQIDDVWKRYSEMPFNTRRELFLLVKDDLHWTLKFGSTVANHLKELFIEGYPDSVTSQISEILNYLKEVAKDNDLLVLTKVTIANHIKSLHESLARLVQTLKDTKKISKCFCKNVRLTPVGSRGTSAHWKKKVENHQQINSLNGSMSSTSARENVDCGVNLSLKFDDSRVRLLVSYPSAADPFMDKFYGSFGG